MFDLAKNEFVADLKYNEYSIYKGNVLNYHESDTSLEILDKSNRIIFNMVFREPNIVTVQGYWTNDRYISVIRRSGGLSMFYDRRKPEDIHEAIESVNSITPIHFKRD